MSRLSNALVRRHADYKKARKKKRVAKAKALKRKHAEAGRNNSSATFIGITGSSGKTTTKSLLAQILRRSGAVQEIGGEKTLLKNLPKLPIETEFVVSECGIAKVGQMKPIADLLRPNVAIITMIALEHKSQFRTCETVAHEKADLVSAVQSGGFVLLNADDPHALGMAQRTSARIVTFGKSPTADFRAETTHGAYPDRLRLNVTWKGGSVALHTRFVGEHYWLPVLAATASAIELGVAPEIVAEEVAKFEPLAQRGGVLTVPDGPTFIVDTVKAPWHSIRLAFSMVAGATASRKRIVLGHMSDFAGSNSKYRDAYRWAREVADEVVFIGRHAHRSKASAEDREAGRFAEFMTTEAATEHIRKTAVPGELILLKGSVDLHLERIALAWMHDVKCWQSTCGKMVSCTACRLYEYPYEFHKGKRSCRVKKIGGEARRRR